AACTCTWATARCSTCGTRRHSGWACSLTLPRLKPVGFLVHRDAPPSVVLQSLRKRLGSPGPHGELSEEDVSFQARRQSSLVLARIGATILLCSMLRCCLDCTRSLMAMAECKDKVDGVATMNRLKRM